MKRNTKKGFTLAELLIVVAILAILVAIMMPVFGAQLNKARLAADLANVRAAYSEEVANAMLGSSSSGELGADVGDKATVSLTKLKTYCEYATSILGTGGKITLSSGTYSPGSDDAGVGYYTTGSGNSAKTYIVVAYAGYYGEFAVDSDVTLTS